MNPELVNSLENGMGFDNGTSDNDLLEIHSFEQCGRVDRASVNVVGSILSNG